MIAHPIHYEAAQVLERLGGDASNFAARQVTPKIAAGADLILAMTRAHRDHVLELAPRKLNKTFTLSEASRLVTHCGARALSDLADLRSILPADGKDDIRDPIGQGPDVFDSVGSEIADLLPPILEVCRRSLSPDPQ